MSRSIDQTVAGKYDKRADVPLQRSRIANLRKVNNYVKAALLAIFTEHPSSRRNDGHQTSILQQALWPCLHMVPNQPAVVLPEFSCNSILDLCCGRGGDLPKYAHSDARRVVIADVSQISVEEAISRYNEMKPRPQYEMLAIHADCTVPGLITDSSLGKGTFDIVACQFALHYACSSPQCLEGLLSNVSDALHPGGVFIGTTLDSNEIVRRLKATSSGFELASCNATLQNSLFKLTYMSNGAVTVFGMKYLFQLADAIDDIPEYMVHFPSLVMLASNVGLALIPQFTTSFSRFVKYAHETGLAEGMIDHVNRSESIWDTLSSDERDVLGLYMTFAFVKRTPRKI